MLDLTFCGLGKPKPAKNTDVVKLRKVEITLILGVLTSFQKLTSQLAQQIETTMAEKAASAGARLKLLKVSEGAQKGKQTQKPKST